MDSLNIWIGFDSREALAYAVCVNSLIRHSSRPLSIHPLALDNLKELYSEEHADGSNAFAYSRFLVPYLAGFRGPALYLDGDMIVRDDIAELFALAELEKDVMVVKHDYKTKHPRKYFGAKNQDYDKKNWSSVMLFPNCANFPCQKLLPAKVAESTGKYLHRFEWTSESRVGSLPVAWNWLVGEYARNDDAKLYHYTLGSPFIHGYENCDNAEYWMDEYHYMMANAFVRVDKRDRVALIY